MKKKIWDAKILDSFIQNKKLKVKIKTVTQDMPWKIVVLKKFQLQPTLLKCKKGLFYWFPVTWMYYIQH